MTRLQHFLNIFLLDPPTIRCYIKKKSEKNEIQLVPAWQKAPGHHQWFHIPTRVLYPISAGVPQGSILGPTLYLLYTNDAEDHLPADIELAAYADDTTLYQSVHTIGDAPESSGTLQSAAVNALAAWGESWKISFEPSKPQTLQISSSHREPWPTPALTFNGTINSDKSSLQLLSVSFDSALSYRCHICSIAVRANQRLGLLKKAPPFLDCHSRDTVYKAFVRPIMEYCPLAWMGAAHTHPPPSAGSCTKKSPAHHWRGYLAAKPDSQTNGCSMYFPVQAVLRTAPQCTAPTSSTEGGYPSPTYSSCNQ